MLATLIILPRLHHNKTLVTFKLIYVDMVSCILLYILSIIRHNKTSLKINDWGVLLYTYITLHFKWKIH